MAALWRQVSNAVEARIALQDVLPSLVDTYGQAAAAVAADWYDEAREAAAVSGAFRAIPASIDDNATSALALWATESGTDLGSIQSLVNGGLQRRITNWSRQTVAGSALADPRADGWQRVGVGTCKTGFCDMLIGRGAVYTEATADFASHDNCKCSAVPAFKGAPRPVKPYTPSSRNISDADRQRTIEYLTGRNGTPAPSSLDDPAWLRHQLSVIESLKDSEWRTAQITRFNRLLAEVG